jgi:hypothetical protein
MKTYGQRRSQLQELKIERDTGARRQKASGATPFAKGDNRLVGKLRIEAKFTTARSFSLKLSDIDKIRMEALSSQVEDWVMQVEFGRPGGVSKKFAVMDWATYEDFLAWKEGQKE